MCVKLVKQQSEISYDSNMPLEKQLEECTKIVVNYDPSDESIETLLSELRRFSRTGISAQIDVEVIHNNYMFGVKMQKQLQKANNDISLNEVVKRIVTGHLEIDQKLQELAEDITSLVNVKAHSSR